MVSCPLLIRYHENKTAALKDSKNIQNNPVERLHMKLGYTSFIITLISVYVYD